MEGPAKKPLVLIEREVFCVMDKETPGYAIVNVDKAILSYNRKTQFNNLLLEGRYFATEVIPGNQQNILQNNTISSRINRPKYKEPLPDFYGKISNKEIFANLSPSNGGFKNAS